MSDVVRASRPGRVARLAVAVTVVVALLAGGMSSSRPARAATTGFVQRCGIHFCVDGKLAYFAGTNTYDLFTFGGSYGDTETTYMDKAAIDAHFANLQADGVSLLRTWMFSHETWHGFEPSKGVMNEQEWAEFDYILDSARRHNVRLIATFENYWDAYGGLSARLKWEGNAAGSAAHPAWGAFFNPAKCAGCYDDYKAYVTYAVNRVNHYTGVAYKDDPTIFSWELMNEPRYQDQTPDDNLTGSVYLAWQEKISTYLKSIDPKHMIGNGTEGQGSAYGYGGDSGVPFVATCKVPTIDWCSAHMYPNEGWAGLDQAKTVALVKHWATDAHQLAGKPFCLCEFQTTVGDRSAWWTAIYGALESVDTDADAFWWYSSKPYDSYHGVVHGAPELTVFAAHAARQLAKSGGTPTGSDTTAPTAPSAVKALSVTSNSVRLGWAASTDNVGVTGYDVLKWSTRVTGTSSATSVTVTGLDANREYTFNVKAHDAAGNVSAAGSVTVKTLAATGDTTAPSTPTGLKVLSTTATSVRLGWTATTDNVAVTGYDIYGGSTRVTGTTSSTTVTVSGLTPGTSYSFTVRAHDAAGNLSAASAATTARTTA